MKIHHFSAITQIFLIATLSLVFSLLQSPDVLAAPVCCQKTKTNDFCQYVDANDCAPDSAQAPTSCDQTSFCKPGCCFDKSGDGYCYANTPKSSCDLEFKGKFSNDASCQQTPECSLGCCIIGTQAIFTTEVRCKTQTSTYPELRMDFRRDITTEQACTDVARTAEQGCCVTGADSCTFGTKATCTAPQATDTGFFKDKFCSQIAACNCAPSNPTLGGQGDPKSASCLPAQDSVYWKDSCGNPEGVKESCDFTKGTLCGDSDKDGRATCESLDCKSTDAKPLSFSLSGFEGTKSAISNGIVRNGESYCIADSKDQVVEDPAVKGTVGTRSPVGSRHYRGLCINGQEVVEPCADFRQEFCLAGSAQSVGLNEQVSAARCIKNEWQSCIDQCNTANPYTMSADDYKAALVQDQQCCLDPTKRDCSFIGNKCIPKVGPGFKFWENEGASTCSKANVECPVVLQCPGTTAALGFCEEYEGKAAVAISALKVGIGVALAAVIVFATGGTGVAFVGPLLATGIDLSVKELINNNKGGWHVVSGKECLSDDFVQATNNLCRSYGDCGANVNYQDALTTQGFKSKGLSSDFKNGGLLNTPTLPEGKNFIFTYKDAEKVDGNPKQFSTSFPPDWEKGKSFFDFTLKEDLTFSDRFNAAPVSTILVPFLKFAVVPLIGIGAGAFGSIAGAASVGAGPYGALVSFIGKFFEHDIGRVAAAERITKEAGGVTATKTGGFASNANLVNSISVASWVDLTYEIIDKVGEQQQMQKVQASCSPWVQPQVANKDQCEACNPDFKSYIDANGKPTNINALLGCSEYRCKSLGASCELINTGTTDERCISSSKYDVNPPHIEAWTEGFDATYRQSLKPVTGAEGILIDKEIPIYQKVVLALKTDQPAQCKMSFTHGVTYDKMDPAYFGSPTYTTQHMQSIFWPSQANATNQKVTFNQGGGDYQLYVRCSNPKGIVNANDFVIHMKISKEPDLTAPQILTTSLGNEAYLTAGQNKTDVTLYVNEPAQCRWSLSPQDYKDMAQAHTCKVTNPDRLGEFPCSFAGSGAAFIGPAPELQTDRAGTTGFVYFKCQDLATPKPNIMVQPFKLTLRGSNPLNITSILPSGDIFTSLAIENITLKVTTDNGALIDGKSVCKYTQRESFKNSIQHMDDFFAVTNTSSHTQRLVLPTGDHTFYAGCADIAGNTAYTSTSFHVLADVHPPRILTSYKTDQPRQFVIVVDEDAACEYSTSNPTFAYGEGSKMIKDGTTHTTTDDASTYYVRCKDAYQNIQNPPVTITFL